MNDFNDELSSDELKEAIQAWSRKIGKERAFHLLVASRLSPFTISKLVRGAYSPQLKGVTRDALLRTMRAAQAS